MKKLYWLRNTQPCKLEFPLKDCAGQPLKFTQKGTSFARRCVTEEVREHELIVYYVDRKILEDEADVLEKPVAAPTPVKSAKKPAPAPEPEPASEVETIPEPAPNPEPVESRSEPVSETVEVEDSAEEEEKPAQKPTRQRRGKKS